MRKSPFCVAILLASAVLFLQSYELDAISIEDTKRIEHATTAVQSLAKAMKALKFVEWISSVGSVLGPAMMAVSMILNIVFSFLGLESPEMRYMKVEFKNLNDRLDSFTERFQEVKKKIDWSSVQMSYGQIEANIRSLAVHRRRITEAKTPAETEEAGKHFVNMYELNYKSDSAKLYNGMISGSVLSDNIFEASAAYTDKNPELSGAFMRGSMQLLMEAFQIEGTFFHLKHNNSELDEYHANSATERMNEVMSKAKELYTKLQSRYKQQSVQDLRRMASLNMRLSHDQFADLFYKYISSKFIQRRWFVAAYNPVKTYEEHYICNSSDVSIPEFAGRNLVLTSVPMEPRKSWSIDLATKIVTIGGFKANKEGALRIWFFIGYRNKTRGYPLRACAIVKENESLKYRCNKGHCVAGKETLSWCNDPACWGSGSRSYIIVVFG